MSNSTKVNNKPMITPCEFLYWYFNQTGSLIMIDHDNLIVNRFDRDSIRSIWEGFRIYARNIRNNKTQSFESYLNNAYNKRCLLLEIKSGYSDYKLEKKQIAINRFLAFDPDSFYPNEQKLFALETKIKALNNYMNKFYKLRRKGLRKIDSLQFMMHENVDVEVLARAKTRYFQLIHWIAQFDGVNGMVELDDMQRQFFEIMHTR